MKNHLEHIFNPLHVLCRLVEYGIDMKRARVIVWKYEEYFNTGLI